MHMYMYNKRADVVKTVLTTSCLKLRLMSVISVRRLILSSFACSRLFGDDSHLRMMTLDK